MPGAPPICERSAGKRAKEGTLRNGTPVPNRPGILLLHGLVASISEAYNDTGDYIPPRLSGHSRAAPGLFLAKEPTWRVTSRRPRGNYPMNDHSSVTNRRAFLKAAAAAAAGPYLFTSATRGDDRPPPSEPIVMAGIGIGNMGKATSGPSSAARTSSTWPSATCDEGARDNAKGQVDKHYDNKDCKAYNDFRELLARTDIDAVHIATPDHWHAIMVIEACRNGKDVYCQKPETRTLREGPLMVEAARRYGARRLRRQPARAGRLSRKYVNKCWGGELGTIKSINVNVGPLSQPCNLPAERVPPDIDWDMWLGPAPWAPYNKARCERQLLHQRQQLAFVQRLFGRRHDRLGRAPFRRSDVRRRRPRTAAGGSHLSRRQGWQVPDLPLRQRVADVPQPAQDRATCKSIGTPGEKRDAEAVPTYKGDGGIHGDFIHCVQDAGKAVPRHRVCHRTPWPSCHLGIIAYELKRSLKWDSAKQEFPGDAEANRFLDRARREPWVL